MTAATSSPCVLPLWSTSVVCTCARDAPERGRGRVTQNKVKSFVTKAYIAEDDPEEEGHDDDDDNQDASCPALGDEDGYGYDAYSYPAAQRKEEEDESYEDLELEEDEALALNALEELDPEPSESGHAIQLQWAANAAFGKAKGKRGKKPKGKAKGKVVRSHLTLEERSDKMRSLKTKSMCLRCGAIGHWAGDPACKFPSQNQGKAQGKARAHIAIAQPRHDDDGGLYVPLSNDVEPHANMVSDLGAGSKARPAAPSSSMQMEGGDRRFSTAQGQYLRRGFP